VAPSSASVSGYSFRDKIHFKHTTLFWQLSRLGYRDSFEMPSEVVVERFFRLVRNHSSQPQSFTAVDEPSQIG
jgi:hypothetical protein